MAVMNMIQAINSALDVMMERDDKVVVFGEDVGYFGGVFRATAGLQKKYGKNRAFDTPIAEGGIVATAIGMGVYGLRPVAEIQFADYIYPAFDQLVSEAARLRYRSAGEFWAPLTVRVPCGGGIFGGQTHSQSPEGIFTHVCGLKSVMPSTPYDAKGMLIAAIEDDDPVLFFEPRRMRAPFAPPRLSEPRNVEAEAQAVVTSCDTVRPQARIFALSAAMSASPIGGYSAIGTGSCQTSSSFGTRGPRYRETGPMSRWVSLYQARAKALASAGGSWWKRFAIGA